MVNLGKRGEATAGRYLRWKGFHILERNYRSEAGEIDLIAKKGGLVVFCEVKARSKGDFAAPYEAVNSGKMARLKKAAEHWMAISHQDFAECRFDVISILFGDKFRKIEHIENAF